MPATIRQPPSARHRPAIAALLLCCWALLGATSDSNEVFPGRPAVEAFIADMVKKHDFSRDALENLFSQAHAQPRILQAMSAPAAKPKPWYKYRHNFVNDARISGGERFWQNNAPYLAKARQQYGVPEEIVTAIIGVETRYGAVKGSTRVSNSTCSTAPALGEKVLITFAIGWIRSVSVISSNNRSITVMSPLQAEILAWTKRSLLMTSHCSGYPRLVES